MDVKTKSTRFSSSFFLLYPFLWSLCIIKAISLTSCIWFRRVGILQRSLIFTLTSKCLTLLFLTFFSITFIRRWLDIILLGLNTMRKYALNFIRSLSLCFYCKSASFLGTDATRVLGAAIVSIRSPLSRLRSCFPWVIVHSSLVDLLCLLFVGIRLKIRLKASIIHGKCLLLASCIPGYTLDRQLVICSNYLI